MYQAYTYEDRDDAPAMLGIDRQADDVRGDRRVVELLQRMGLN